MAYLFLSIWALTIVSFNLSSPGVSVLPNTITEYFKPTGSVDSATSLFGGLDYTYLFPCTTSTWMVAKSSEVYRASFWGPLGFATNSSRGRERLGCFIGALGHEQLRTGQELRSVREEW